MYLRARYANLGTGTFLTKDPFEGIMSMSVTRNGYLYVHANPVNLTDPGGESPLLALGAKAGKFAVSCAANPACVAKAVAAIAVLQQVYKDVLCAIDPNQAICDVPTPLEMTCNAILDVAFNIPLSDMRHLAPGLQSSPLVHGFPAWYSGTQGQAQTSDLVDAQVQPRERTEDEATIYYHYTDLEGYTDIINSEPIKIRPNNKNQVFITQMQYGPYDAWIALFIGNTRYEKKGEYFLEFILNEGVILQRGTQPNEMIHYGTMRVGSEIAVVLRHGRNPFVDRWR